MTLNDDQIEEEEDDIKGKADLIYYLPSGVQLILINGDIASQPTKSYSLQIFKLRENDEHDVPQVYAQVDYWVYPLKKNKTTILKNEVGAYLMPFPSNQNPDQLIGVLLSAETDQHLIEELDIVLSEYAELRTKENGTEHLTTEERDRLSNRISKFLITKAQKVAATVQEKSEKAANRVNQKGEKYRSNLEHTDKDKHVPGFVKGGVFYVHKGTKTVASCTKYLVDKIAYVGSTVGKKVADGAQKTFPDGMSGRIVSGTIEVLGGGLVSVGTVFMSLESGSRTLCKSIASQTVQNVEHKYGKEASHTTQQMLSAAGHGSLAAIRIFDLGHRSIPAKMAMTAGIQTVSDLYRFKHTPALPEPSDELNDD